METKELRLGNQLHYDFKRTSFNGVEKVCEVKEILSDFIKTDFADDFIVNFKPIQLTDEWMIKLGFQNAFNMGASWWKHPSKANYYWMFDKSVGLTHLGFYSGHGSVFGHGNKPINYVHDLQNTYYAIRGEELVLAVAPTCQ